MKNFMKIISLCLVLLVLVGCAPNKTYRTDVSSHCSIGVKTCKSSLELSGLNVADSKVALAFVEINDQGLLRDRNQLSLVSDVIQERGQLNSEQIVMVFVHGWHNNSDANNGNVKTFRSLLEQYSQLFPGIAVTGVYAGWRGDSWLLPSFVSFWNRKDVSIEVGNGALVDIISSIEKASIKTKSRMVSIGHSFGGSALFNAVRPMLLSRLDSPPVALIKEKFPMHAAVGDLILIVNPAFEAMQFWPLHSATVSRIADQGAEQNRGPRMMILQGQRDWATRYAFPIARALPVLLETHSYDSDSTDGGRDLSERKLDTYSIGHFNELNTHDLTTTDDSGRPYTNCGANVSADGFVDGEWLSPNARVRLNARSNFIKGDPFWVVYDQALSKGHNDLENKRLTCMIADLLSTYTRKELNLYR